MIKFLIEKEFKQLLRNSFLPEIDSCISMHDYAADALGGKSGNQEYTAEYCG